MRPTLKPNMPPSVIPLTVTSPKSASMGGLSTSRFAPRASNSREATPTAGKPKAAINGDTEASVFKSDLTNIRNLVTCSICDQLLYEPWTLSCGKYSSDHFLTCSGGFPQVLLPTTSRKRMCLESLLPSSCLTPFFLPPDKPNTDPVKKDTLIVIRVCVTGSSQINERRHAQNVALRSSRCQPLPSW
jgi:hypothetical protein